MGYLLKSYMKISDNHPLLIYNNLLSIRIDCADYLPFYPPLLLGINDILHSVFRAFIFFHVLAHNRRKGIMYRKR
jgi:hypothetical protein